MTADIYFTVSTGSMSWRTLRFYSPVPNKEKVEVPVCHFGPNKQSRGGSSSELPCIQSDEMVFCSLPHPASVMNCYQQKFHFHHRNYHLLVGGAHLFKCVYLIYVS
jgi:hypothetical protein